MSGVVVQLGMGVGMLGRSGFFLPRPDAILIKCWRMPVSRKNKDNGHTLPLSANNQQRV